MSTALDSPLIIFAMSLFVQWLSAYLGYFLRRKRQSFSKDAHGDFGTVLPLVGVNYQINVSDRMADAQPIGESSGWKPLVSDFASPYREPDGTPMSAEQAEATSS